MFAKRLFIYLIGFFLGCVIVYFLLFKDKNRSFFPSAIVLDTLRAKEIIIEKKAGCILSCYQITHDKIKGLLGDGDVIFSESNPRETPKKYVVEIETPGGKEMKLTFELTSETAKIISVKAHGVSQECMCE